MKHMNNSDIDKLVEHLSLCRSTIERKKREVFLVGNNGLVGNDGIACYNSLSRAFENICAAIESAEKMRPKNGRGKCQYMFEHENGDTFSFTANTEREAYKYLISYLEGENKAFDDTQWRIIGCTKVQE